MKAVDEYILMVFLFLLSTGGFCEVEGIVVLSFCDVVSGRGPTAKEVW